MNPEDRLKCKNLIIKHEGFREFPYIDTTGNLTIGFGHNLKARGLSYPVSSLALDEDIAYWMVNLDKVLPFYKNLNIARQAVLIDMCHNLGLQGLLDFREMMAALAVGNYATAAACMLQSKWADQVGQRAIEDAYIMKTGEL